jgi:hypothetical protein
MDNSHQLIKLFIKFIHYCLFLFQIIDYDDAYRSLDPTLKKMYISTLINKCEYISEEDDFFATMVIFNFNLVFRIHS